MKQQSVKIRQITDAAIITAVYAVFLLISRLTGALLEYELFFVVPLPLAMYSYKYSWKTGFIPLAATFLISIFIAANPLDALVYTLPALCIGLLLGGVLLKKEWKPVYIVLILTLFSALSELLSSIVLCEFMGIENIFVQIQEIMEKVADLTNKLNINIINLSLLQAMIEGLVPSVILLTGLMEAVLVYLLCVLIIMKSRLFSKIENRPAYKITIPPMWISLIYLADVIASFATLRFFIDSEGALHVLFVILLNIFIIGALVYLYYGVRTCSLYIRYINKKWLLIIVYLSVFILPLALSIIGILNTFFCLETRILSAIQAAGNK